ncbi:MAG: DNA replication/repair protein RecF [Alphaproteobacteria bacterium]|nr:DNA replication/repair protein RecF [Alphaproteobacteria bacterium]
MDRGLIIAKIRLTKLKLFSYRNYSDASFDFDSSCIILHGANGCGKTNLLEAISLLSPGRGLRRATYKQMCAIGGNDNFVINASLANQDYGEVNIGTGLRPASARRQVHINSQAVLIDELTQYCRISWLTPLMDKLFIGPYSDRRRFLDRLVLSITPRHGAAVRDYEKLMLARNYTLQEPSLDEAALDSYEANMARLAVIIAQARNNFVTKLAETLARMSDQLAIKAALSIKGEIEAQLLRYKAEDAEANMQQLLHDSRMQDRAMGRCSTGTHRSDFCIKHAEKNMSAELCSSGEQKALLLNLILAQAELTKQISGMAPILLFDELVAYLDIVNKTSFLAKLQGYEGQIIITATDNNLLGDLQTNAQLFDISQIQ